ncbi:MAG: flagellar hook-length control protein FliK [Steroidobacteraceae bacterium]
MSARIATAPSSATATPLTKPTAATTAAAGADGSQAAPAARGAPGSSSGAGAEGGSNSDFFSALIEAAQSDPATPGADGGTIDRARDGMDDQGRSSDPSQSNDAASAAGLIAATGTPDVASPGITSNARSDSSIAPAGQFTGRGASRFVRQRDPNDVSVANPDAVAAAMLVMANALPGAPAMVAGRAASDGASTPADADGAVASSTGAPGHPASSAISSFSMGAEFAMPLQRLGGAGTMSLSGSDRSAVDAGDDARGVAPNSSATPASLSDLVRSLPAAGNPVGLRDNTIASPVGSDGWPRAVAAQLHWFVSNGVQSATLRLVPEHLGPIDVHVDVQQSQVNINFNAAHPDTRAALEQSVPRLREILAGSGQTLGQANVQQQSQPRAQAPSNATRAALAAGQSTDPVVTAAPRLLGLVDEYV